MALRQQHRGPPLPALGQVNPGSTLLGFTIMPLSGHPLCVKLVENRSQDFLRYLEAQLQGEHDAAVAERALDE